MSTVEIRSDGMPMLPNAARKRHWSARASDTRTWREAAHYLALAERNKHAEYHTFPWASVSIRYTFVRATRHHVDIPNLAAAMKPVLDGMVDAGILTGDDKDVVISYGPHKVIDGPSNGFIVTITRTE